MQSVHRPSVTAIRRVCSSGLGAVLLLHVSSLFADSELEVRDAWIRATVPGQPVAAAYLSLRSLRDLRLVSARSDLARAVEIHEMSLTDGVMRMRHLESLEVPEGREIRMTPGGIHLMFLDVRRPLLAGEQVELDLVTAVAGDEKPRTTRVPVPVRNEVLQ